MLILQFPDNTAVVASSLTTIYTQRYPNGNLKIVGGLADGDRVVCVELTREALEDILKDSALTPEQACTVLHHGIVRALTRRQGVVERWDLELDAQAYLGEIARGVGLVLDLKHRILDIVDRRGATDRRDIFLCLERLRAEQEIDDALQGLILSHKLIVCGGVFRLTQEGEESLAHWKRTRDRALREKQAC